MKQHHTAIIVMALLGTASLTACFKDEAANAEADIEKVYLHLSEPLNLFYHAEDTLQTPLTTTTNIVFQTKLSWLEGRQLSNLAPQFILTPGATIYPENGSMHDFSSAKPVTYTVTSEDRQWQRTYQISFAYKEETTSTATYNFDHYELKQSTSAVTSASVEYYSWYELNADNSKNELWATGNPGFLLTAESGTKATDFPTVPDTDEKYNNCVKLTTRSTGKFGQIAKKPIAAGNIFIGDFNVTTALSDPLGATQFGKPVSAKPLRFQGAYKYQRGTTYTNKDMTAVTDQQDYGSIYAVFYDNNNHTVTLNGNDVLTNSAIVAIAQLGDIDNTDGWVTFDKEFAYNDGVTIDAEKLAKQGYSLAIVASSSKDGASFNGAVGSTLHIAQFRIENETEE